MQTNAIASNSGWFRANSCETSKHDWILMFTNWTLFDGKWSMPGFRVDPGGAELVAGRYTVKAVYAQSQVILQGPAGREI